MRCPECLSPLLEAGRPQVSPLEDGNGVILATPYECSNCEVRVAFSQAYKATKSALHTYVVEG